MDIKVVMPETTELWQKIVSANDVRSLVFAKHQLERENSGLKDKKKQAQTLTEYKDIEKNIKSNEIEILRLEEELVLSRFKIAEANETYVPELPGVHNAEFAPFLKEYTTLLKGLEKELSAFCEKVEPMIQRMVEIEDLDTKLHAMRIYRGDFGKFDKLNVTKVRWDKTNCFSGINRSLSGQVSRFIAAMKED